MPNAFEEWFTALSEDALHDADKREVAYWAWCAGGSAASRNDYKKQQLSIQFNQDTLARFPGLKDRSAEHVAQTRPRNAGDGQKDCI